MKKTIKFGVIFSASFLSFQTLALGDDPVNCQTIIVERPVYAGFASCLAGGQVLSQNVTLSYTPSVRLSSGTQSCYASIPFAYMEQIPQQVCDYTPKLSLSSRQVGSREISMTANASDRDGNIVSYEWWVNDVKQSSTSSSLWLSAWDTYPTIPQTSTKVKVTVSDNDGFSTSATKYVQYAGDSACGNRRC